MFEIGEINITTAARLALKNNDIDIDGLLQRHKHKDYGAVTTERIHINNKNLQQHTGVVVSMYVVDDGNEIYVMTNIGYNTIMFLSGEY